LDSMKWVERTIKAIQPMLGNGSRNEWIVRLLNLPRCTDAENTKGVVIMQIDGLSQAQFQRAVSRGRLPFLSQLMKKRGFRQKAFYAGLPSSTPSVQAELFYGVRTAVPAFEFMDRKSGKRHAMFLPASANEVARKIKHAGRPLLEGGAAYATVFSGGAAATRYCAETMGLNSVTKAVNPLKWILVATYHFGNLMRILGYALLEIILAIYDFFKGLYKGKNILKELTFIPTRLFVCVLLRELVRFRVKLDVTRGVPTVAANFLGYDEQAHRRGPASGFAHWTLKGIDDAIKDIYHTAMRSKCREYQVVIFSDHGQESVESYSERYGKSVKEAIRSMFQQGNTEASSNTDSRDISLEKRYQRAGSQLFGKAVPADKTRQNRSGSMHHPVGITTMGPLGHVYLSHEVRLGLEKNQDRREMNGKPNKGLSGGAANLAEIAKRLCHEHHVPLVFFKHQSTIAAVNDAGLFDLETYPEAIFGKDHPFLHQVAEDFKVLCRHSNAGDLVISGWKPEGTPLSFNIESGAHGGPGREETRGVVLLPPVMGSGASFMRPGDVREQILRFIDSQRSAARLSPEADSRTSTGQDSAPGSQPLRVITYNIRSCMHMDGSIDPDRTANAIARFDPDIAAIQEVDAGRGRTGSIHQGRQIAGRLNLSCQFYPVVVNAKEQYGLAILSRFPIISSRCFLLPRGSGKPVRENRGVMMTVLKTPLGSIQFVNTHLGLHAGERRRQIAAILDDEWMSNPLKNDLPLIVCGDFNAGSRSFVYKRIVEHVSDVQTLIAGRRFPKATFYSRYPLLRLDHIFLSRHFYPSRVVVPTDAETRMVSDHLPVYCELLPAAW